MECPLRVLLIEDSEDDALLIIRELRRDYADLQWQQVQTAKTLCEALANHPWDVIISDYRLPGFNAPAALEILHESGLDIPFIVVSGTIGERSAVEMMKAGAHDYVMKDNLARLPEAIRREVRDAKTRAERRQSEIALIQSEAKSRAILAAIPDLMFRVGADGVYREVVTNNLELELFFKGRNPVGLAIAELVPEDVAARKYHYMQLALTTGKLQVYEQQLQVDGLIRDEEVRVVKSGPDEVLFMIRDISDRKRIERQLQHLNQELEAKVERRTAQLQQINEQLVKATRLKDEFLATMSHELRTPLNAIMGMAEGLQEGVFAELNPAQLRAVQTIDRSAAHLLELINDILDLAKVEAGQIELECIPTAIVPLCSASLAFVRHQVLKKQIQLDTKFPTTLPDVVIDERRIRQVLINLLSNAVKFTPEGGCITLEIEFQPSEQDCGWLHIAVRDTGIGIAPEHMDKLFQPFVQIDSALNRQYMGTGLGLVLVKRIVEMHGGYVTVTSEVGVGSCFTIVLPCNTWTACHPQPPVLSGSSTSNLPNQPVQETSPLVLLADDNDANISSISSYLKAKGYRLVLARNGQEVVQQAQVSKPDVIVMDVQMPVIDGLEAMRQIRHHPQLATVPIIALTALAMTGDRERCIAAGANDYLSKPVKLKHLTTMIQRYVNRHRCHP
ncbi:MAG: response regulator [Cyanobacteria bacterium]|nr:response regulator [Cyanobacteriota bacterium]